MKNVCVCVARKKEKHLGKNVVRLKNSNKSKTKKTEQQKKKTEK